MQHMSNRMKKSLFNAVSKSSVHHLREMLFIYGPEVMADLAKSYNEERETPLLLAIKRRDQNTARFLVQDLNVPVHQRGGFSWKEFHWLEVPPLFAAVISGQPDIVDLLIETEEGSSAPFTDVDSIASSSISRQEKIDILELIGAAYIANSVETANRCGIPCWIQAINLRYSMEPTIPKIPFHMSDSARIITGHADEIATLEGLKELETNYDALSIQAVLVFRRILNPIGLNFFTIALMEKGLRVYYEEKYYRFVVNAAIFILEEFQVYGWEYATHSQACDIADSIFYRLTASVNKLLKETSINLGQGYLSFNNLMAAFSFSCADVERRRSFLANGEEIDGDHGCNYSSESAIPNFVIWIARMLPRLSPQEKQQFNRLLTHYILNDNKWGTKRCSLLHSALDPCFYNSKVPFDASIITVLLENGADPNRAELEGDSPLHIIALDRRWKGSMLVAAHLLVEAGCHLDHGNDNGETPLELFKQDERKFLLPEEGSADMASYKRLINSVLPLSCLCAQFIQKRRIPFENQFIPGRLQLFISRHSASRKRRHGEIIF